MIGNLHRHSLLQKMLVLMLSATLIEFALLYGVLFWGGATQQLKTNAFNLLQERITNRRNDIEDDMASRWGNLDEMQITLSHLTSEYLNENQCTLADLEQDTPLASDYLEQISNQLIYIIRKNSVSGAFLILDSDKASMKLPSATESIERSGVYIRDYDPESNPDDSTDLMAIVCPSSVSRKLNLALDIGWQPRFEFSSTYQNDFFEKPYLAAQTNTDASPMDLGYWCPSFTFKNEPRHIITYSVPLISEDGSPYAVFGIEISSDHLINRLPYAEINGDKQASYLIAVSQPEKQTEDLLCFSRVISSGPCFSRLIGASSSEITFDQNNQMDDSHLIKNSKIKAPSYGCIKYIQLYNTNTPFEQEKWAVIGIIEERHLLEIYEDSERNILIAMGTALLIGICSIVLASIFFSRPIILLAKKVRDSDPSQPVKLGKVKIAEIDELSGSIEDLSRNVAEFSSTLSKIMQLANYRIAAFECRGDFSTINYTDQFFKLLSREDPDPVKRTMKLEEFRKLMLELDQFRVEADSDDESVIYELKDEMGNTYWIQLKTGSDYLRYVGVLSDITKEYTHRKKIEFERDYDLLTSLLNRRAFQKRIEYLFQVPRKFSLGAMIMLDLDNLKYINDTYGHDCGDQYITLAASVLRGFSSDKSVVARMSGDEFYAFFIGDSKEELYHLLHSLENEMRETELLLPDNQKMKIRLSGGYSWYPYDSTDYQELIRYADFAMYRVKHTTKGKFVEFQITDYQKESYLLENRENLNQLIDSQMVSYYFQPIVKVSDGSIFAYEALMRPIHPAFHSPMDVLTIAKLQSKLYQIERLTWFKSLEIFSGLSRPEEKPFLFINSIPNQILSTEDQELIEVTYSNYLNRIVMELTEEEKPDEKLNEEKYNYILKWGGKIALDDYGSGYNGDKVLLSVQPQFVKIDRELINQINQDKRQFQLVQNMISFLHKNNIEVIAEGIETLEQMKTLIFLEADYLQGFYLATPKPQFQQLPEKIKKEVLNQL